MRYVTCVLHTHVTYTFCILLYIHTISKLPNNTNHTRDDHNKSPVISLVFSSNSFVYPSIPIQTYWRLRRIPACIIHKTGKHPGLCSSLRRNTDTFTFTQAVLITHDWSLLDIADKFLLNIKSGNVIFWG